jgi:DNA replication protein DnaC
MRTLRAVHGDPTALARGLSNPPSTSLLFMGDTGTGKTTLATAMLDAWVRLQPSVRTGALFVEAGWLSRARARHRLGQEAPLVESALAAPLVVLDDLGNEREDRDGCITDLVYGRANADLPTWVTCGLLPKEAYSKPADDQVKAFAEALSRRYDGGFVRRIIENGKRVMLGSKT